MADIGAVLFGLGFSWIDQLGDEDSELDAEELEEFTELLPPSFFMLLSRPCLPLRLLPRDG